MPYAKAMARPRKKRAQGLAAFDCVHLRGDHGIGPALKIDHLLREAREDSQILVVRDFDRGHGYAGPSLRLARRHPQSRHEQEKS